MAEPAKYLFEARRADGSAVAEYVAASGPDEARTLLEARGLTDIRILDNEMSAGLRALGERAGVEADLDVDLVSRFNPTPLALVLVAMRKNWLTHVIGLAIAAGVAYWSPGWALVVLAVEAGLTLFPGWIQWHQVEMHKSFWRGDFDRSERLARKLKGMSFHQSLPAIVVELDSRIANALVMKGDLAGALAMMEPWGRPEVAPLIGPTMYRTKVANLHFLARDWPRYLAITEEVLEATDQAEYARIDVAQLTARLGDDDARAAALLEGLDEARMPALHVAFVKWGRGVLHLRAGRNEEALRELTFSVEEMQRHAASPTIWGSLACASGYLCVAMARTGRQEAARGLFQSVRGIIGRHGEPRLQEWLREAGLSDKIQTPV